MGESTQKLIRDYAIAVTAAVVIASLTRIFLLEAYRIPSQAMKPSLLPGDTIFVSKSAFGLRLPGAAKPFTNGRLPKRGEVVIFSSPSEPDRQYVKRVIALPGEQVAIQAGRLTLNGKTVETDPEFPKTGSGSCGAERLPLSGEIFEHGLCWEPPALEDFPPAPVPEGFVFVMGDLRSSGEGPQRQAKGENWGLIPLTALRGSALWVWLSIEPRGIDSGLFPEFRFERMFRRIN